MMKKLLYLIVSLSSVGFVEAQIQISPALAEMVEIKPLNPQRLENNFYVGQMGNALPQEDYLEVTKKYFLQNDALGIKDVEYSIEGSLFNLEPSQLAFAVMNNFSLEGLLPTGEKVPLNSFIPNNQVEITLDLQPMLEGTTENISDYFPCHEYLQSNCIATAQKNAQYIHQMIDNNKVLLDRLLWRIDHSTHNEVIVPQGMNMGTMQFPNYRMETVTYQLNLSQSIVNIAEGQFKEGLEGLSRARKRIDITYDLKSVPLLTDLMVVIVQTQDLDQTMNGLLDSGLLNQHLNHPALENIVKPYPAQMGLILQKSIIFELKDYFRSSVLPYLNTINVDTSTIQLNLEEQYIVLKYWQNKGVKLTPRLQQLQEKLDVVKDLNRWKNLNDLEELTAFVDKASSLLWDVNIANMTETMMKKAPRYSKSEVQEFQKLHEESQQLLDDWYKAYFVSIGSNPTLLLKALNQLYPSTRYFNDQLSMLDRLEKLNNEGVILTTEIMQGFVKSQDQNFIDAIHSYTMRLYEQQNYHQLVYLKYLIMRDKISVSEIPAFLNSMGDLAKNTITKEPYHFNAETRALSTPLSKEKRYIPYSVRTAQQNDPNIQSLEVTIPLARKCRNQLAPQGVPYEGAFKYQSQCREQNPFKK